MTKNKRRDWDALTPTMPKKSPNSTRRSPPDVSFDAVDVKFDWTSTEWDESFWPAVNTALGTLQHNDKALQERLSNLGKQGLLPDMLDHWCATRERLNGLDKVLETALTRAFMVLGHRPRRGDRAKGRRAH
jgi:hypothetical protein